jgi:hypothetical protein
MGGIRPERRRARMVHALGDPAAPRAHTAVRAPASSATLARRFLRRLVDEHGEEVGAAGRRAIVRLQQRPATRWFAERVVMPGFERAGDLIARRRRKAAAP